MVNVQELRNRIEKCGMTVSDVAKEIGIDKATLYRRLSNGDAFTIGEVSKLTEVVGLSHAEAVSIFLTVKSHGCDFDQGQTATRKGRRWEEHFFLGLLGCRFDLFEFF